MAKDLAIVLNSGGLHSAVASALAAQKHRLVMVHVTREKDSEDIENASRTRVAFDQQASHFKPYREHVISLPQMRGMKPTGSASRASGESAPTHQELSTASPRYVSLISHFGLAAQLAVEYQAAAVYVGLRTGAQADPLAQGTEYVQIWQDLLQLPCHATELEFAAPLLELELWQVVDLGVQINAPLDRAWSCDNNSAEPCWACKGCRDREAAFQQAAKPDPLKTIKR
jgi:7-cyano-7-deazaguanine synthase in queuosine biosynthesis